MTIFLASDHAGFKLKNALEKYLKDKGYEVEDLGPDTYDQKDDYPIYAYQLTTKLLGGEDEDKGILVCGSGQGMAMAANRVHGIRAAVIWDKAGAEETREDNDSNVLSLPARMIDQATAFDIAETWLKTPFSKEPRHHRRIDEVEHIYG